ncbi:hypothetical protein J4474_04770 [Candidatus Pacearchaeota archaeon]|nr:hypothetical protein [Candidatus Pacearchaeota archaeon]
MERGDINILLQLVEKLDLEVSNLEDAYQNKNSQNFNESKKKILKIQDEIAGGFNGK